MFALPVAKQKTKSGEFSRAPVAQQRLGQPAVSQVQLLQRRIGNQALLRLLAQRGNEPGTPGNMARLPGILQAKLKLGAVNDPLEHEADRVADQVMRMPAPGFSIAAAPQLSRKCAECEEEEKTNRLLDGKPKPGEKKQDTRNPDEKKSKLEQPPSREPCDKKCGTGGPYGSTECELDLKSGLLTGKVTKEVFDKNPCTLLCVEVHEGVHAKKIAPYCAEAKKCLDAANGDHSKQGKCLDKYEIDLKTLTPSTECAAYTAEQKCLSNRANKAECKSADGKKRWTEQTTMVKCYKDCFCKS